ncbi:hypothetical protein SZ64_01940 [Erythrobacter sp. SG61-1L]|nr:hypothetical protein SZ64_01940 [Erythrobacter sp. SG61-1L]
MLATALVWGLAGTGAIAQSDTATPSSGVFKAGEDLYTDCSSDDEVVIEKCYGFIMGVFDTVTYMQDIGVINPSVCPVGNAVVGDVRDEVLDYLSSHDRSFSAVSLVVNALTDAYPCAEAEEAS